MQASALHMEQQHWRLPDACWRLIFNLQKGSDASASQMPAHRPSLGRRLTPDTNALRVRISSASASADEGDVCSVLTHLSRNISAFLEHLVDSLCA